MVLLVDLSAQALFGLKQVLDLMRMLFLGLVHLAVQGVQLLLQSVRLASGLFGVGGDQHDAS